MNDFSKNIYPVLSVRYADDTSLMAWSADIYELQTKLQIGTNKAMEWLRNNRLLVNNEKSTCMLLGTRQRISNLSLNMHIGDNILNSSNEIKLLGMVLDNCLSYDEQISYICKKVAPKLGILYRLSKFLSANILNIIYFTIVQPHFDYCISVWGNCPLIHLSNFRSCKIELQE